MFTVTLGSESLILLICTYLLKGVSRKLKWLFTYGQWHIWKDFKRQTHKQNEKIIHEIWNH